VAEILGIERTLFSDYYIALFACLPFVVFYVVGLVLIRKASLAFVWSVTSLLVLMTGAVFAYCFVDFSLASAFYCVGSLLILGATIALRPRF
jgi:hypothetical protein